MHLITKHSEFKITINTKLKQKIIILTWPAPAFIIPTFFVFSVKVFRCNLIVDFVATINFDVGVYYSHHL